MTKETDDPSPDSEVTANVASCVMRVSDLDQSLNFYRDVFSCRVAVREADMALLLTPKGFQIYLHAQGSFRPRALGAMGVHHLLWSTDSRSDLQRIKERLQAYDVAVFSHIDSANAVTFLEASGPDEERIIISYPSPRQLPRKVIAERLRG
jgi:catechol-2,3-dioxygenase